MRAIFASLYWISIACGLQADSSSAAKSLVPRTILALVDGKNDRTLIHRNVEMILNHYGLIVKYVNIDDPLPIDLDNIRGVLVWQNQSGMRHPKNFLEKFFLFRARKLKFVFLGAIPALIDTKSGLRLPEKLIEERYAMLGIKLGRKLSSNPFGQKLEVNNSSMIEFERKIEVLGQVLPEISSTSEKNQVHLSVVEKLAPHRRADLVVTGEFGGYALNPIVLSENPKTFLRQWTLNPFLFFETAYDLKKLPRPDVTTLNGRRMIYCHIDGDAFTGNCRFDKKRYCGEVVFDDILKKYLFPHTLSLVHCWFDPNVRKLDLISVEDGKMMDKRRVTFTNNDQTQWIKAAQRVFKEPWIEYALHGYGHPLKWEREILALSAEGKPFDVRDEFDRSIEIFSQYIVKGSQPKIFLWTGDCAPTEKQLLHSYDLGLVNMNGGDTMFDSTHNSHTSVAPLYRQAGKALQIYASAANENIYTNEWAGPFYGFRNVIETFERTESPRRLAPVNIYYHWYSGEYKASMQALVEVYSWAKRQPLVPIWGGRHIENVTHFIQCKYIQLEQGWQILNHGRLKTIRFDDEEQNPIVSLENNVLGYNRHERYLYVHLGPKKSSKILWQKDDESQVMLSHATCVIEDMTFDQQGLNLKVWGFTPAEISLLNLKQDIVQQDNILIEKNGNETLIKFTPQGHQIVSLKWVALN